MVQISWIPAAAATTTTVGATATTGCAQILPSWAPDIAALPTTTSVTWQALVQAVHSATTMGMTPGQVRTAKVVAWRKKGGHTYVAFNCETGTETKITLTYRAVGELVRP